MNTGRVRKRFGIACRPRGTQSKWEPFRRYSKQSDRDKALAELNAANDGYEYQAFD